MEGMALRDVEKPCGVLAACTHLSGRLPVASVQKELRGPQATGITYSARGLGSFHSRQNSDEIAVGESGENDRVEVTLEKWGRKCRTIAARGIACCEGIGTDALAQFPVLKVSGGSRASLLQATLTIHLHLRGVSRLG